MPHSMLSFLDITPDSHFPLQNLPYGIFSRPGESARAGVAVGDWVLDLAVLEFGGFFDHPLLRGFAPFSQDSLNRFMGLGKPAWQVARRTIQELLAADNPLLRDDGELRGRAFHPRNQVLMHLPAHIGDYTDFYSSREHATNVGIMFRGRDNALMPNWLHLPVAYHGRASSIIPSGQDIHRPYGQLVEGSSTTPIFSPSRQMDFELEMGFFVGPGNDLGRPIAVDEAPNHIFGLVLVNDWSARDIQRWEYQPLGPFNAKNLATSISPWVVPLEALEPFRTPGPAQEPKPLTYLQSVGDWAYDIHLEVQLQSEMMDTPLTISRSNFRYLYWNMPQQLAHHTITGCNMRPGDLLASGTISGPEPDSYGSLLELTWRGERPIPLPTGEQRQFLADGDRVTMTGYCQGKGYKVGFGEVTARLLPPAG
ncbi:MAG: fumarylacetoacetase [Anaerolineae bacterium]|nr:fumarylacetoacetase [Anaerolineae bacterium]